MRRCTCSILNLDDMSHHVHRLTVKRNICTFPSSTCIHAVHEGLGQCPPDSLATATNTLHVCVGDNILQGPATGRLQDLHDPGALAIQH